MRFLQLSILFIIIWSGLGDYHQTVAFSPQNVGVKAGDKIIHQLVRYSGETNDPERQIGVIEITEITYVPPNIGKGNDTIITSFERKYSGKTLYQYENGKLNMSEFSSTVVYTNWTYWKEYQKLYYQNTSDIDSILLINHKDNLDTILFSVTEIHDTSNSTHKIEASTKFDLTYEKTTGFLNEFSWVMARNITIDEDSTEYDIFYEIKLVRILTEPSFTTTEDEISLIIAFQPLIILIIIVTKFRYNSFKKVQEKR